MDYAKKLKLRFRVGGLDPPQRRKRHTRSQEKDAGAHMCPCGGTIESRTHAVGDWNRQEGTGCVRGGDEEIRRVCDMEEFGRLESSEKTIAILGDRWWPQTTKQDEDRISEQFLCSIWKKRNERPNVGGVSVRSRNRAPSRKGCVVHGQMTKASSK